ncbi:DMT family transporter [Pseudomonas sp. NPDC090202]|uniref:DMT family transporter n=1 Tax=unclassified Pseudomonas TaxID=196821 RepID=UPI0037F9A518
MDVALGLMAALFWGGTDFLVGVNARAVGVKRAVYFGQGLGFLIMCVLLLCYPAFIRGSLLVPWPVWWLGVLASLFTVSGALALSKAFALGKASIVAPLVTSYGVFTTLLSWGSGERISSVQLLLIGVCVLGVVLSSLSRAEDGNVKRHNGRAVVYALMAALLYGSSFWVQGRYTLPALGPVIMLWLGYLVGLIVLSTMVFQIKEGMKLPPARAGMTLIAASLLNLGGFSAFSYGAMMGSVSVVTIISTLSGGIAAVLGYLFFKERLSGLQVSGVTLVLIAAFALHLCG